MNGEFVLYKDGGVECEGYVARPKLTTPSPIVLVCHAWAGQDEFARKRADELAALGYIGFAVDVYGKGNRGGTPERNSALMTPFASDRAMLRKRLLAAVDAAHRVQGADTTRVGAIGFCFGGLCALDIARANAPGLRGIVAFHGLFAPPNLGPQPKISASILCLHGYDDPMAKPESVVALARELTDAGADWEVDMYGHTVHAFTNPEMHDAKSGLVFKQRASDRAFAKMRTFFAELFTS